LFFSWLIDKILKFRNLSWILFLIANYAGFLHIHSVEDQNFHPNTLHISFKNAPKAIKNSLYVMAKMII